MLRKPRAEHIHLERLSGDAIQAHIEDLAYLRIEIFRDYPYLYDGDLAYEAHYLQTYSRSPESVIIAAWDGDQLVGASTAIPLRDEADYVIEPFAAADLAIDQVFYFGESVLRHAYRGLGIGKAFFSQREAAAQESGAYTTLAFCAVQRPADHPRRPPGYRPLDSFWQSRGFRQAPELVAHFSWKDLDETTESAKPMVFWLKPA